MKKKKLRWIVARNNWVLMGTYIIIWSQRLNIYYS